MESPQLSLAFVLVLFGAYVLLQAVLRFGLRLRLGSTVAWSFAQSAWLGLTGYWAGSGWLVADVLASPPVLVSAVVVPALVAVCALPWLPTVAGRLAGTGGDWLVSAHAFRIPVALILLGLADAGDGAFPWPRSDLGRMGCGLEVGVGVLALVVGYRMHKGRVAARTVVLFNLLGLLATLCLVAYALLSVPTPMQQFGDTPQLVALLHVPFVWLLAYLAPMTVWLHLMSMRHVAAGEGARPRAV